MIISPGAVIGRVPDFIEGTVARKPTLYKSIEIGRGVCVGAHAVLYLGCRIGDHCLIGDMAVIREGVVVGDHCLIGQHVSINYDSVLGNNVRVMNGSHITGKCTIGNNVFIGVNVITSNDRHIDPINYKFDDARVQGPVIEDDVVIGSGANILSGVTIGRGALIGAGALITKNVAAGERVLGLPGFRKGSKR